MVSVEEKAKELYNYFRSDPWIGKVLLPYTWEYIVDKRETLGLQTTIDWWKDVVIKAQLNKGEDDGL